MELTDADKVALQAALNSWFGGDGYGEFGEVEPVCFLAGMAAGIERAAHHFDGRAFLGSTWRGEAAALEIRALLTSSGGSAETEA
jgi:hypothetical protein